MGIRAPCGELVSLLMRCNGLKMSLRSLNLCICVSVVGGVARGDITESSLRICSDTCGMIDLCYL